MICHIDGRRYSGCGLRQVSTARSCSFPTPRDACLRREAPEAGHGRAALLRSIGSGSSASPSTSPRQNLAQLVSCSLKDHHPEDSSWMSAARRWPCAERLADVLGLSADRTGRRRSSKLPGLSWRSARFGVARCVRVDQSPHLAPRPAYVTAAQLAPMRSHFPHWPRARYRRDPAKSLLQRPDRAPR